MGRAGVDHHLAVWTIVYLTNRPQYVRLRDCMCDVVVCNTGVPQGTVLSPFLYTLYTSDFSHNSDSCHLQKFSDDTAVVGRVSVEDDGVQEGHHQLNDISSGVMLWVSVKRLEAICFVMDAI